MKQINTLMKTVSFKINPGIIMRRNGYFSGDYEIEFNFLREVGGSSESVLVNENNEIYTGEYFVSNRGLIYKGGGLTICMETNFLKMNFY